jgi:small-conductance mechanosensitive channel
VTDTPDDELAAATAALREAASLQQRLSTARSKAEGSAAAAAAAQEHIAHEAEDIHKLESLSLTGILSRLKGSHADDLARETAEHEAAQYEYRTREARAVADQRNVDHLQNRLDQLGDVAARHTKALAAKEQWLRQTGAPAAAKLSQIAERRGHLTAELAEIAEASGAGKRALADLRTAAERIGSARSWSAYDTWFDGGIIASMIKNNRLDDVVNCLRSADRELRTFTTELADVHMQGVQSLQISSFTRTLDVWFDNFFTDLMVRDQIIEAQQKVDQAIEGVKAVLARLDGRKQKREDELAQLQAERTVLLTSS